jgi:hypothetical protein
MNKELLLILEMLIVPIKTIHLNNITQWWQHFKLKMNIIEAVIQRFMETQAMKLLIMVVVC